MKHITASILLISLSLFYTNIFSQEIEDESKKQSAISVKADIVSTYIWRGMTPSPSPNIQPEIRYKVGKLEMGLWGSTDFTGNYKEIDIFITYSIKGFSATFTDYYNAMSKKYFDYNNKTTGHQLELGMSYQHEKFPLQLYVGTIVYGADKRYSYDTNTQDSISNDYSTYIELNYSFNVKQVKIDAFLGATPFTSMYGDGFAIVYTGLTASRKIKITSKYSLPIFATFAVNPQKQDYFVIFGITL